MFRAIGLTTPKFLLDFHASPIQINPRMTQEIHHPILQKIIKNLDVSKEFKVMAHTNGYKTLHDILAFK